jgi:hypothetical protein
VQKNCVFLWKFLLLLIKYVTGSNPGEKNPVHINKLSFIKTYFDGFRGLVVSMLASGIPAEAVGFFRCGKNPQACLPSEGK